MVELAHSQYGSKSAKIRALAIDILRDAGVPDKDYYGELVAIHNWVRDNIRYTRDPIGQETLSYPEETAFNSRAGDCDDESILEMALLGSVGIESYPVVVGMFPGHFSHVYIHGRVPAGKGRNAGKIIPLDPIMKNWEAGREAPNVKAKKTYPQLSNPLTMNGLPMGSSQDVGDLGAYATGPSYLDREDSHAGLLVVPDQQRSNVHNDKTVANSSRVNMPFEGIDSMFGGPVVRSTGGTFTEASAGDGGSIVESGGQLVPRGFLRNEPDLREVMNMTPATADQLGPRGPIFMRKSADEHQRMRSEGVKQSASLAWSMRKDKTVRGVSVDQTVGSKRYDIPSVQQQLRSQKGLVANPVRNIPKQQIVTLNSLPLDRLGAKVTPCPTLGEELAGAEMALAGFKQSAQRALMKVAQPQALALREAWKREQARLNAEINALEQKILALRQQLRASPKNVGAAPSWRSAAVVAGQQAAANAATINTSVSGLGADSFMDTLKKPIVWGPIAAFVGVFALRMYLKKRRAAAVA
jgi:hypothetical protein